MNEVPSIFARPGVRLVSPAARANLGAGTHPRISIQGGAFALRDAAGQRFAAPIILRESIPTLPVVIIGANEQLSRIYFEEDFDPEQGMPPVCFSDNGVGPSTNASVKQARTCAECPHKEWGSAISKLTGKGIKACHDLKKLAVRVIGDQTGQVYEFQVPPATLKALGKYDAEIAQYTAPGTDRPADLTDLVTGIQFVPGKTGELQFTPLGFLDCVNAHENGQMWINWAANGAPEQADDGGQCTAFLVDRDVDSGLVDRLVGNNDQPYQGAQLAAPAPQARLEAQPQGGALQRGSTPQQPAPAVHDQSGWRGAPGQPAATPQRAFAPPPAQPAPVQDQEPKTTAQRGHGGPRPGAGRKPAAQKTIAGPAPTAVPFPTSAAPQEAADPNDPGPMPAFLDRSKNGMAAAPAPSGGMMDGVRKAMGLKT